MKLFELSLFSLSLTQKRRFPPPDPGHVREAEIHLALAHCARNSSPGPGSTQFVVTTENDMQLFPATVASPFGGEDAQTSSETDNHTRTFKWYAISDSFIVAF